MCIINTLVKFKVCWNQDMMFFPFQFNDISLKIYVKSILNTCKPIKKFLCSIFLSSFVEEFLKWITGKIAFISYSNRSLAAAFRSIKMLLIKVYILD